MKTWCPQCGPSAAAEEYEALVFELMALGHKIMEQE